MTKQDHIKKFKPLLLLGIYVLMLALLASCQKADEEISVPNESEAFTTESQIGAYIYGISLLDGSGDNIIDNASNLTVNYPVEVSVKGEPYEIVSDRDLLPIQKLYDLNPYVPDFMSIQFPIEVTRFDHSKIIINDQLELKEAITYTYSNQLYEDIECVDFNYPISLATYDTDRQIARTISIEDDESLFRTFTGLDKDILISFNFPMTVLVDGDPTTVDNQTAFREIIEEQLSACDENDRWYYSDDIVLSTIRLNITDMPYPIDLIEEAKVTIDRIDVKTGAANDSVPYITLFNDTLTFDLIDLTNGVTAALGDAPIPVGDYSFFRVYVENGSVLLKDGSLFDLKVPSGSQSGILLKPDAPIVITEEGSNEFLFDFDLSRSFIPRGNPNDNTKINGFIFRPVIKVSSSEETGVLKGQVTDMSNMPLEEVQITVFAADTVNAVTFSGAGGHYEFLGLTPGDYLLEAEKTGYEIVTEEFVIEKSQELNLDLMMSEL